MKKLVLVAVVLGVLIGNLAAQSGITLVKAQAVAAAVTNAGYQATVEPQFDLNGAIVAWKVRAHSERSDVPVNSIKTIQDAQAVQASCRDVLYQ